MSSRSTRRLVLVGADNLLGREIKEVIEAGQQNIQIESFASNGEANFGEEEGEAVYRQAVTADVLRPTDVVVLAGTLEGSAKALAAVKAMPKRPRVIDCTGALDHEANARILAPLLDGAIAKEPIVIVAHAAATMLALVLSKLGAHGSIARAIVQVFEPASEQGKQGIAELQQQTTSLLSLKTLDKKLYDTQMSFAMVPAYGEESALSLISIEQRVEEHLATLLARFAHDGKAIPMPSLRLIQAPVFHGYTISCWVEFEKLANVSEVQEALRSDNIDVRTTEHEAPTNIGMAGQSGLVVGDIRIDPNNPRAVWLWAVADNLRTVADGVKQIVSEIGR